MLNLNSILHHYPEGKERRKLLLFYLRAFPDTHIFINRKYCRILSKDKDLSLFVKKGILKQYREGFRFSRHSFLKLNI